MEDLFNNWLYEACKIKAAYSRKDPHDLYSHINLTDAKLAFIEGTSPEEYSLTIKYV